MRIEKKLHGAIGSHDTVVDGRIPFQEKVRRPRTSEQAVARVVIPETGRPRGNLRQVPRKQPSAEPYCYATFSKVAQKSSCYRKPIQLDTESYISGRDKPFWAVERTRSWLPNFRQLRIRFECLACIHEAFMKFTPCIIYWQNFEEFILLGPQEERPRRKLPQF